MFQRARSTQPRHDASSEAHAAPAHRSAAAPKPGRMWQQFVFSAPRHEGARRPQNEAASSSAPASPGAPLPAPTRALLESRMNQPAGDVRVHTDAKASEAAQGLGTPAFTVNKDIYFASGKYQPGAPRGLYLLGHEVAHALQPQTQADTGSSARSDAGEREAAEAAFNLLHGQAASVRTPIAAGVPHLFSTQEHEYIGGKVAGSATTDIDIGSPGSPELLTFGQAMAMGDYFKDLNQLRDAAKTQGGRDQIHYAKWRAAGKTGPEPVVSGDVKKAVMERFFTVSAENVAHFSAGGTALTTYRDYHTQAVRAAFLAGFHDKGDKVMSVPIGPRMTKAQTIKAFGQHYLTDMFSAGHVRTPRSAMRTWYQTNYADSVQKFITYMGKYVHDFLVAKHPIADFIRQVPSQKEIEQKIEAIGGAAIRAFSLGDIVSLAYHDKDNQGLKVMADVDEKGNKVTGGNTYTAKGDNLLTSSSDTEKMVVAAAKASYGELQTMYSEGEAKSPGRPAYSPGPMPNTDADYEAALAKITPFAAEKYIPKEDMSGGNITMSWYWGSFDAVMRAQVDTTVKGAIVSQLKEKVAEQGDPEVKAALESFVNHLSSDGIAAIEAAVGKKAGP